jgi:hypothetical protein
LKIAYENNTDIPYDKKDVINSIIISLYKILSNQVMVYGKTKFDDVKLMEDSSSLIIQSMVSQNGCQDENYAEVIDKLSLLNIKSSYLYAFEPSISHLAKNKWLLPKGINLKAYHHYLDVYSVSKNEQYIVLMNCSHISICRMIEAVNWWFLHCFQDLSTMACLFASLNRTIFTILRLFLLSFVLQ